MYEEIVRGKSLEEIRNDYAQKWDCRPEELVLEVLDKPGFISRQWKVRVSYEPVQRDSSPSEEDGSDASLALSTATIMNFSGKIQPIWDEEGKRYRLTITDPVRQIVPCPEAGALYWNGEFQEEAFRVSEGDEIEFIPAIKNGLRVWEIEVPKSGLTAIAKVRHEKPGRYTLPEGITADVILRWKKLVVWRDSLPAGEYWGEERLNEDLKRMGIVHGVHPSAWTNLQAIEGTKDVVLAEATLPLDPVAARLEDFVGECSQEYEEIKNRIDFFGSKMKFVQEGDILARKIPGKAGVPGQDVLGHPIPPAPVKDLVFKLKKNVRLSEDGLEVVASCAGLPFRIEETSYLVENIYLLNQDVDLATGSIEFPGDVFIYGNVQDGLHVFSGGKVEIQGSVSKAEIRAEKGLTIRNNVLGGRLIVGERFVVRSELLRRLLALHELLTPCLMKTIELMNSPNAQHLKAGQCLKLILERKYVELPKIAVETEKFILGTKDELITQDLILSVRTAKRFLWGLGPLEEQALPFLQRVNQVLEQLVLNISVAVPEKLNCSIDYIQGATIECGGSFECHKGAYNSIIQAEGAVKIEGVCRGGKVISGGNVEIRELGGSGVSITTVQLPGTKRLKVGYCHPNVSIVVDKEIIRIEEAYKQLEVYRDRGLVQVERLRANPV